MAWANYIDLKHKDLNFGEASVLTKAEDAEEDTKEVDLETIRHLKMLCLKGLILTWALSLPEEMKSLLFAELLGVSSERQPQLQEGPGGGNHRCCPGMGRP